MSFGSSGGKFESALLHVRDEKASGTSGGGATSGSFLTRTLNTVLSNEISGASLASNQITLPSGTYFIFSSAPFYAVDNFKCILRNITDSSNTLIGTSEYTFNSGTAVTRSFVIGRFTISAQKTFEIQYRCTNTLGGNGLGANCGFGNVEVYTDVQIWKVA